MIQVILQGRKVLDVPDACFPMLDRAQGRLRATTGRAIDFYATTSLEGKQCALLGADLEDLLARTRVQDDVLRVLNDLCQLLRDAGRQGVTILFEGD